MTRTIAGIVLLLASLPSCLSAGRHYVVQQDPTTKQWTMDFSNSWIGGPVNGNIEIHGADGSSFVATFDATGDTASAERARIVQEVQGSMRLAQLEALLGQLAAAYAQTRGINLPAPPVEGRTEPDGGRPLPAASEPASRPAH